MGAASQIDTGPEARWILIRGGMALSLMPRDLL
jgi:hypothetical protein